MDFNRLLIILAVLEKYAGFKLSNQDVFVNIAGGLRIDEPAVDLALLAALASGYNNQALAGDWLILGEVGLSGEVRRINHLKKRLNEAAKLGLKRAIIPQSNLEEINISKESALEIKAVSSIRQALQLLF